MLAILLFVPGKFAGASFIGFAIGESLGASVLRIAGGIFTKIADIGSDLMKVIFKIGEDDPRNPGTIADCVGDNAGDSVGPTADGFETYGVTGVALITFILLAITQPILMALQADHLDLYTKLVAALEVNGKDMQAVVWALQVKMLVWIFVMRILMIITSIVAFWINGILTKAKYQHADDLDFEKPLTNLVWITSILSIVVTFVASYFIIGNFQVIYGSIFLSLSVPVHWVLH